MNTRDIEELREHIAARLLTLKGTLTLVVTRKGILPASKKVVWNRMEGGYTTLSKIEVWDGSRVQCSAGSHTTGQSGVRVSRLRDYAKALPLATFNPKRDVIRLRRNGDMVQMEVIRMNR